MSKNVIGFIDIHKYVSVNVAGSKDVEHMNKINSYVLCDRVFFQKR